MGEQIESKWRMKLFIPPTFLVAGWLLASNNYASSKKNSTKKSKDYDYYDNDYSQVQGDALLEATIRLERSSNNNPFSADDQCVPCFEDQIVEHQLEQTSRSCDSSCSQSCNVLASKIESGVFDQLEIPERQELLDSCNSKCCTTVKYLAGPPGAQGLADHPVKLVPMDRQDHQALLVYKALPVHLDVPDQEVHLVSESKVNKVTVVHAVTKVKKVVPVSKVPMAVKVTVVKKVIKVKCPVQQAQKVNEVQLVNKVFKVLV